MKRFRVPRRQVRARLLLDDGRMLDGQLYTASARSDGSPGRLSDRLADPSEEFLPVSCGDDRFLLNTTGIIAVRVEDGEEGVDVARLRSAGAREVPVRLSLAGGTAVIGRLLILMPEGRARVIDAMNAAPRFVPVLGDGCVTFVHRRFIASIRGEDLES